MWDPAVRARKGSPHHLCCSRRSSLENGGLPTKLASELLLLFAAYITRQQPFFFPQGSSSSSVYVVSLGSNSRTCGMPNACCVWNDEYPGNVQHAPSAQLHQLELIQTCNVMVTLGRCQQCSRLEGKTCGVCGQKHCPSELLGTKDHARHGKGCSL